MADATLTITVLDMPEIMAILDEAIDMVPEWERPLLQERWEAVRIRAREKRPHA